LGKRGEVLSCGNVMKSVLDPRRTPMADLKGRSTASARTLATARAVAALKHPHLVEMRPSSADHVEFEPDLQGGARLSDICRARFGSRPVPLAFGLRILLDALSGLAALHGQALGFSHGELSPCNIVVGRDGRSRLVGVVAAHFEERASPSPEAAGYAAPERLRCDPFDHRADVFSAGMLLWEMITGRSFRGQPASVITAWVVDGKVPDPVHPEDAPWVVRLAAVATRALAVDPSERWPHIGVMGEEIEKAAEGHIASPKEVRENLVEAAQPKAPISPAERRWTPSVPPTTVSIAPQVPRASQTLDPVAPIAHEPSITPSRARGGRRQSVVAWSTLLAALVLLGVTVHEVLDGLAAAKTRLIAAPVPSFVVTLPASPSAARPEPAAAGAADAPAPPSPARVDVPAPAAPAKPAVTSAPRHRLATPHMPRKGGTPAPAASSAPRAPKALDRDETFGI
jgi:hypothetical protein